MNTVFTVTTVITTVITTAINTVLTVNTVKTTVTTAITIITTITTVTTNPPPQDCSDLVQKSEDFIARNFTDVAKSEEFFMLSYNQVREIINLQKYPFRNEQVSEFYFMIVGSISRVQC